MTQYHLSPKSIDRLDGVDPRLQKVVHRAIEITSQDFLVVEGLRSKEQMMINYGKGRTAAQCEAKGIPGSYAKPHESQVTWLKNPLASRHGANAEGLSEAVDLGAWINGQYDGKSRQAYDKIAHAMLQAAANLGVNIRWGADWDEDGKYHEPGENDMAHFELVR